MFIYATALAAAIRLETDLQLNVSGFAADPMRQYSLGLWSGVNEPLDFGPLKDPIVGEKGLPYNPEVVAQILKNSTLFGYFQCERYFQEIESLLQTRFAPKQPLSANGQEMEQRIKAAGDKSVFLTVRRTDYTRTDFHGVLTMGYYLQAAEIIAAQVPDPQIFVFSDEPEWCKDNFRLPYKTVVAGNYNQTTAKHLGREDEELWLMRQCKHAILANSSYSWWGAWLNPDRDRIVIGPKQWFYKANEDPKDIIPARWLTI